MTYNDDYKMSHYRNCLNIPELKPVYYCSECSQGIQDGETYFKIYHKKYCNECIKEFQSYAEAEEFDDWEDA